jgi:hypothetical protein
MARAPLDCLAGFPRFALHQVKTGESGLQRLDSLIRKPVLIYAYLASTSCGALHRWQGMRGSPCDVPLADCGGRSMAEVMDKNRCLRFPHERLMQETRKNT